MIGLATKVNQTQTINQREHYRNIYPIKQKFSVRIWCLGLICECRKIQYAESEWSTTALPFCLELSVQCKESISNDILKLTDHKSLSQEWGKLD